MAVIELQSVFNTFHSFLQVKYRVILSGDVCIGSDTMMPVGNLFRLYISNVAFDVFDVGLNTLQDLKYQIVCFVWHCLCPFCLPIPYIIVYFSWLKDIQFACAETL